VDWWVADRSRIACDGGGREKGCLLVKIVATEERPGSDLLPGLGVWQCGRYMLVNVVQRAGLQTSNLRKNQTKKTAETAHWRFGRPFLGQNAAPFFPLAGSGRCLHCTGPDLLAYGCVVS